MELLIIVLCAIVGTAAAVRSTWSPCGLSMLSTVTPLAESGRGRRWGATAAWFIAGATLGGLALGLVAATGAAAVAAAGLGPTALVALGALAAAAALALDLAPASSRLAMPHHRRQVNEDWLVQFRGWVYGGGFGLQIGSGVSTYIMTAAVYLTVALAALTSAPAVAVGLVAWFGFARGLAIVVGARSTSPDRLVALHRGLDRLAEPVRRGVLAVEVLALTVLAAAAAGAHAALLTGAVASVATVWATLRQQQVVAAGVDRSARPPVSAAAG